MNDGDSIFFLYRKVAVHKSLDTTIWQFFKHRQLLNNNLLKSNHELEYQIKEKQLWGFSQDFLFSFSFGFLRNSNINNQEKKSLPVCDPVSWGGRIHRLHLYLKVRLLQQGPVGCGCRIHQLHICREVRFPQRVPIGWGCRIHRLHLYRGVRFPQRGPVGWGCRIHRLHLCKDLRLPQRVLDMTLNNLMIRLQ